MKIEQDIISEKFFELRTLLIRYAKQEIKDPILENMNPQDNNERLVPKISYIPNLNEPLILLKP